jgi:hypothetical protein
MRIVLDIEEADIERIVRSLDNKHAYTRSRNLEDSGYKRLADLFPGFLKRGPGQAASPSKDQPCATGSQGHRSRCHERRAMRAIGPVKMVPDYGAVGERSPKVGMGMRIPMKWGTDSDEVGQHQGEATLVMAMITEVPHFSQVFLLGEG